MNKTMRKVAWMAVLGTAVGLTGCLSSTETGFDPSKPNNGAGGNGGGTVQCPEGSVLDGAQCTLSTLTTGEVAVLLVGTPLEGVVQCLDPTVNDIVDGPDALVQGLLDALQTQDPSGIQAAAGALADSLTSVGTNVPLVLSALQGDQTAINQCTGNGGTGGAGGGGAGSGSPIDPTALCAIPTLGPQIVAQAGGSCSGAPGGGGADLSPAALCAVPGVGPALASAAGATCDAGAGGDSPVSPEQLCAIPTLGPQLAAGVGASCPSGGGAPVPGGATLLNDGSALGPIVDPVDSALLTPLSDAGLNVVLEPVADTLLNPLLDALGAGAGGGGGAPDASQLCAIPGIGAQLASAAGGTCTASGATGGTSGPTGTPLDAVLGQLPAP